MEMCLNFREKNVHVKALTKLSITGKTLHNSDVCNVFFQLKLKATRNEFLNGFDKFKSSDKVSFLMKNCFLHLRIRKKIAE